MYIKGRVEQKLGNSNEIRNERGKADPTSNESDPIVTQVLHDGDVVALVVLRENHHLKMCFFAENKKQESDQDRIGIVLLFFHVSFTLFFPVFISLSLSLSSSLLLLLLSFFLSFFLFSVSSHAC